MKRLFIYILAAALTSQAVSATTTSNTPPTRGTFCSNLDKTFATLDKTLTLRLEKQIQPPSTALSKPAALVGNVDAKRVEITAIRRSISNELARRATTAEHKKAMEDFLSSIEASAAKKDKEISVILAQSQTQSEQLLAQSLVTLAKASSSYALSIQEAKVQARNDCASGTPDDQAKISFKKSVYDASKTLEQSLKSARKTENLISTSKAELKKEVEVVMKNYRKSVEQAKEDFKLSTSPAGKQMTASSTTK